MTARDFHADPDWQALYAGLIEDPLNVTRRLVIADWLDEYGTADASRRALVIRLANGRPPRESAEFGRWGREWDLLRRADESAPSRWHSSECGGSPRIDYSDWDGLFETGFFGRLKVSLWPSGGDADVLRLAPVVGLAGGFETVANAEAVGGGEPRPHYRTWGGVRAGANGWVTTRTYARAAEVNSQAVVASGRQMTGLPPLAWPPLPFDLPPREVAFLRQQGYSDEQIAAADPWDVARRFEPSHGPSPLRATFAARAGVRVSWEEIEQLAGR